MLAEKRSGGACSPSRTAMRVGPRPPAPRHGTLQHGCPDARQYYAHTSHPCSHTHAPSLPHTHTSSSKAAALQGTATLKNSAGMEVKLAPGGAAIQSLVVPDRDGNLADVVLGFDDPAAYNVS